MFLGMTYVQSSVISRQSSSQSRLTVDRASMICCSGTLDDLGAVVVYSEFSEPSRAVVIDLQPNATDSIVIPQRLKRPDQAGPLAGCVGARPMRRW